MGTIQQFTKSKKSLMLILAGFVICIYYYCNTLEWWSIFHNRCETPENEMNAMKSLTKDTHIILEHFNLTHFPMFGRYL